MAADAGDDEGMALGRMGISRKVCQIAITPAVGSVLALRRTA
jgi:hypothetical protein